MNGEVVFHVFSHCQWVNLQIAGAFRHFYNRTANITGCSLPNDFGHRATRHGENGSAAGHGFYHRQPKRFVPLDWEEHSHGVTQKIVLHSQIGNPRVLHEPAINLRLDLSFKVITILRLNVAGNLQRDSGSLCHINSNMGALQRRNSAYKTEVLLLVLNGLILAKIDAMVDGSHFRH